MERKILVFVLAAVLAALVGAGAEPLFSQVLPGMSKISYENRLLHCATWGVFSSTGLITLALHNTRPLYLGIAGVGPAVLYYVLLILAKSSVLLPFSIAGFAAFCALGLIVSLIFTGLWAMIVLGAAPAKTEE